MQNLEQFSHTSADSDRVPKASEELSPPDNKGTRPSADQVGSEYSEGHRSSFHLPPVILVLGFALAWCAMAICAQPFGNFPLNDDWTYAHTAFKLGQYGRFEVLPQIEVTLATQAFWGALFVRALGASFEALRLSTWLLGSFGLLVTYKLTREVGANRTTALVSCCALGMNLLYFSHALTFMTDVPFCVGLLWTSLHFVKALKRSDDWLNWSIGIALSIGTVLIRQYGILLPLSFLVASMVLPDKRKHWLRASVPLIMTLAFLLLFEYWLSLGTHLPLNHPQYRVAAIQNEVWEILSHPRDGLLRRLASLLLYGSWLVSPLAVAVSVTWKPRRTLALLAGSLVLLAVSLPFGKLLPIYANTIDDFGLGPHTLKDGVEHLTLSSTEWWRVVITLLSYFSLLCLITLLFNRKRIVQQTSTSGKTASPITIYALVFLVSYGALITFRGYPIDRYFLPVAMPLIVLLAGISGPNSSRATCPSVALSGAICLLNLTVSVVLAHDYFQWQRARWDTLKTLERAGLTANLIDGGYEYNALRLYDPNFQSPKGKSWYWVHDDKYAIAFSSLPSYRTVRSIPYSSWSSFGDRHLYLLQRLDHTSGGADSCSQPLLRSHI